MGQVILPSTIGGGTTNVPTAATKTFSPTNFGLNATTIITGGATNVFAPASPGTSIGITTADLDGISLNIMGNGRPGAFHIYFGSTKVGTAIPFTDISNSTRIDIPIHIPQNTDIGLAFATTTGSVAWTVCPVGYQSSVTSTVTSVAGLGAFGSIASQGITMNAANSWVTLGTLAADSQGFATIQAYTGSDGTRTSQANTNPLLFDIGIGSTPTVLIPNLSAMCSGTGSIQFTDVGPFYIDLPSGTIISVRAKLNDGTLPDTVSLQAAMMY